MNYYERIQKILPKTIMALFTSNNESDVNLAYLLANTKQKELMVCWYGTNESLTRILGIKYIVNSEKLTNDISLSLDDDNIEVYFRKPNKQ